MGTIEGLESVFSRLKRLKEQEQEPKPRQVINPFTKKEEKPIVERPRLSKETIFTGKVERAILKMEGIDKKMRESDMYLNYYDELNQAKKEFLEVLKEAENHQVDFPERVQSLIDKIKRKHKIGL